jgi:hypothetical protein
MRRTPLVAALVVAAAALARPASAAGIPSTFASAIAIDKENQTVTLPLFRGQEEGFGPVWFILTESSSFDDAVGRGVNWAPKLVHALGTAAVQGAHVSELRSGVTAFGRWNGIVHFEGSVNFSGSRVVVPADGLFPVNPALTHAGPFGDASYSPLFTLGDGRVYNGAHVANRTGVHPKVLSIDYEKRQVTIRMTHGFYLHRDVFYISTEASDTVVAALENASYVSALADAPLAGNDDPSVSSREPIIPIVNGPKGASNPQRQGLQSAVAGEGDPLNIIREEPQCSNPNDPANCSALEYSPLWDVHAVYWTGAAIDAGQRVRLTSHKDVKAAFDAGLVLNFAANGPENQDPEIRGLRALGVVVNCPPMFVAP